MIQERSPGVDGQQYTVRFTAEIPDFEVLSFDVPFLFYDGTFYCLWHHAVVHCDPILTRLVV